jgi:mannose-6-phosphate isomerase-like protein (cupin superfamily)
MSEYSKLNLRRDVDDVAKEHGLAPNLEARFPSEKIGMEKSAFSYQKLAPNFRQPFGHQHEQQEEVYVFLSGSGRMKLDDDIVEVEQYDAIRIPPEITRGLEAGDDGLEVLVFGAPNLGPASADTEPQPGWWSD